MAELSPVSTRERAVSLDILRGFALMGVLMGNTLGLYTGRFATGRHPPEPLHDQIAHHVFSALIEQKAMMLLTLLFGFGFANILVRARERGETGTGVFVRRLVVLFLIGWCHVAFLAFVDITWNYAAIGFGLLLFRNVPNSVRLICGLFLTLMAFPVWMWLEGWRTAEWFMAPGDYQIYARQWLEATRSAGYAEMMRENVQMALVFQAPMFTWNAATILGRFALGYVAGVGRWFDRDGADHLRLFRRLAIGGLAIGVPCTAFVLLERLGVIAKHGYEVWRPASGFIYMLSLLALAIGYTGVVVLLVQRARWKRVLSIFAPVGRMPLTTYVSQSLFATMLFWGRGLAWEPPGTAGLLGVCLVIFMVQTAIAHIWLRYFRFGPLEWVWRSLVYMKRQPMRV